MVGIGGRLVKRKRERERERERDWGAVGYIHVYMCTRDTED